MLGVGNTIFKIIMMCQKNEISQYKKWKTRILT